MNTENQPTTCNQSPFQLGLASLLTGGVLFIAAPITAIFDYIFFSTGRTILSRMDLKVLYFFFHIAIPMIWLLCIASLVGGIKGWTASKIAGTSAGLSIMAIFLNVAALMLWLFAGVNLLMILNTFVP